MAPACVGAAVVDVVGVVGVLRLVLAHGSVRLLASRVRVCLCVRRAPASRVRARVAACVRCACPCGRVREGSAVGDAAPLAARRLEVEDAAVICACVFVRAGSQFKMQLSELVGLIESGRAHYVRCIKPNGLRRPHTFEAPSVIRQLRCSGVTETVRARRAGWPVSHAFQDFVNRYSEVYMALSKVRSRVNLRMKDRENSY